MIGLPSPIIVSIINEIIKTGLYRLGKYSVEKVIKIFSIEDNHLILSVIRIASSKGENPKNNAFE